MKENRRAAVTCGLMTLMLFAALAVYMRARLEYAGTWGQTLSLAALFTLVPFFGTVFLWSRAARWRLSRGCKSPSAARCC